MTCPLQPIPNGGGDLDRIVRIGNELDATHRLIGKKRAHKLPRKLAFSEIETVFEVTLYGAGNTCRGIANTGGETVMLGIDVKTGKPEQAGGRRQQESRHEKQSQLTKELECAALRGFLPACQRSDERPGHMSISARASAEA